MTQKIYFRFPQLVIPVKSMTTSLQCCITYILCWSRDEWSLRMLCLVHQSLASTALSYLVLCDLYLSMVFTISTHLSTGRAILRTCTSFHHRSFAVTGPCLWNSFLATLWQMIFIFGQEITAHCDFWFFYWFCSIFVFAIEQHTLPVWLGPPAPNTWVYIMALYSFM